MRVPAAFLVVLVGLSRFCGHYLSFTTHGGSVYWMTATGAVQRVAAD